MVSGPTGGLSGGLPACSVRGRGSVPADAHRAFRLSHRWQGCMEEPGGLGFGAAARFRGRCTEADSDTPGLESVCLSGLRKQSPHWGSGYTSQERVFSCGLENRANTSHWGLQVSGSSGIGQWWEGRASCSPAPAHRPLPALGSPGVETQHQAWTLVIFMDQTLGKHSGQLTLGVAFSSCLAAP